MNYTDVLLKINLIKLVVKNPIKRYETDYDGLNLFDKLVIFKLLYRSIWTKDRELHSESKKALNHTI